MASPIRMQHLGLIGVLLLAAVYVLLRIGRP